MELVEGPTLANRIASGALPIDETLTIASQIAEALEAAHEKGIIHRDVKPANIKVARDGVVKVLDFGLARVWDGAPHAGLSMSPSLTAGGLGERTIMGTPTYMSPEQARGQSLDRRTDVWSFGCVPMKCSRAIRRSRPTRSPTASPRHSNTSLITRGFPPTTGPDSSITATVPGKDRQKRLDSAAGAGLEIDDAIAPVEAETIARATPSRITPVAMAALAGCAAFAALVTWALMRIPVRDASAVITLLDRGFARKADQRVGLRSRYCPLTRWPASRVSLWRNEHRRQSIDGARDQSIGRAAARRC